MNRPKINKPFKPVTKEKETGFMMGRNMMRSELNRIKSTPKPKTTKTTGFVGEGMLRENGVTMGMSQPSLSFSPPTPKPLNEGFKAMGDEVTVTAKRQPKASIGRQKVKAISSLKSPITPVTPTMAQQSVMAQSSAPSPKTASEMGFGKTGMQVSTEKSKKAETGQSFRSAFASARKGKLTEFTWNGKKYNTKLK